jgi:hypothetical protein
MVRHEQMLAQPDRGGHPLKIPRQRGQLRESGKWPIRTQSVACRLP